jgi:O-succinylbenzoic acid--CoA ligase
MTTLVGAATWMVLVLVWSTIGAPLSASRLLGATLLGAIPLVIAVRSVGEVRAGMVVSGALLLAVGVLLGPTSGASIGTAVGGMTAWAAIVHARSASDPRERTAMGALAALALALVLAPSLGPAGPRSAAAALAVALGFTVGARLGTDGTRTRLSAAVRNALARSAAMTLVVLAVVRTIIDIDSAAVRLLLAFRRFASLVLPAGLATPPVPAATVGDAALLLLPWVLPLVGAGVALVLLRERPGSPARDGAVPTRPLPSDVVVLVATGITASLLLDLVAVNWASETASWVRWPARHVETVLWGSLAIAVTSGARTRGSARTLAVLTGAVLLTVLASEWRVDGVALRPMLLAVPVAFGGLVALGREGATRVATGVALAGVPILTVGLLAGMLGTGPVSSGARAIVPGSHPLLINGQRLAGLTPDPGQLGMIGAAFVLVGSLLAVASRRQRQRAAVPALGWTTATLGGLSVVLAEGKIALLALALAGVAAAIVVRAPGLARRLSRTVPRRTLGATSATLVTAAPFIGARVLDPTALRPEVWRLSVTSLTAREWALGLGAQPLRGDREFHVRVDSSWDAVQAHNQVIELLLIAGLPGLLLMAAFVAGLVTVGLRLAPNAGAWPLAVVVFTLVAGASGPNLTYFGHDVASVLTLGLLVAVASEAHRDRTLVRLDDDPATLTGALLRTWEAGHAAVVAPLGAALPAAVERVLAGGHPLPARTALVVPTSGSTGEPRAVVLTHDALAASTAASAAALGCTAGERWALALPLRHVAGLQVLARARALGTDPYVVTDPGDPHAIAAAADHAEHIALVPTQLVRCLDAGPAVVASLAQFRSVLVGGGPLAPERAAQAREAGVALTLSYGMTETSGGCVYDGRPLDGVTIDIEQHASAPAGAPGRIRVRGPMLANGYLDASPEDASRFTADGWFVTDDLGRITADGALEVLGRVDAVINTGGMKVDPVAIETILRADAWVADAVVVGVPDAEWGERVVAIVVPAEPSTPPTLERLREVVGAALPTSHAPREVRVVDRIARDAMGKVSAEERARLSAG